MIFLEPIMRAAELSTRLNNSTPQKKQKKMPHTHYTQQEHHIQNQSKHESLIIQSILYPSKIYKTNIKKEKEKENSKSKDGLRISKRPLSGSS